MIRLRILGGILIAATCAVPAAAQEESEFQPVFGWNPGSTGNDGPRSPTERTVRIDPGLLQSPVTYGDFVLRFDYRLSTPGSGGALLVRSRVGADRRRFAYAIALTDEPPGERGRGRITAERQELGAVRYEPSSSTATPDTDWIACEVRLEGDVMQVRFGGLLVSTAEGLDALSGGLAFSAEPGGGLLVRNLRIAPIPEAGRPRLTADAFDAATVRAGTPGVTMPQLASRTDPEYPPGPWHDRIEGMVVLDIVVATDGLPTGFRVVRSPHPDLTRAAIACVRQWRFTPATREGAPVPMKVTVEIVFNLKRR